MRRFVVCLDDCEPKTLDDRAANMLHGSYHLEPHTRAHEGVLQTGTLTNRWYDKLQLIVCRNGAAGINFEHSAVDGVCTIGLKKKKMLFCVVLSGAGKIQACCKAQRFGFNLSWI